MRHEIIKEGVRDPVTGMLFFPNSLVWYDRSLPVSLQYRWDKPVGKATDLRREADNSITAEIQWLDHFQEEIDEFNRDHPGEWDWTDIACGIGEVKSAAGSSHDGMIDIYSGVIREIAVLGTSIIRGNRVYPSWDHERDIPYYGD